MKLVLLCLVGAALLSVGVAVAQTPAPAPADSSSAHRDSLAMHADTTAAHAMTTPTPDTTAAHAAGAAAAGAGVAAGAAVAPATAAPLTSAPAGASTAPAPAATTPAPTSAPTSVAPAPTATPETIAPAPSPAPSNQAPPDAAPRKLPIYFGGVVGFSYWDNYLSVSLEPLVGYNMSPKLSIGGKLRYEYIHDSQSYGGYSSNNFGGSAFSNYRLTPRIYAHGEAAVMNYDYPTGGETVPFLFVGGGYSQSMRPGMSTNFEVYWDLINDKHSPYAAGQPIVSVGVTKGF